MSKSKTAFITGITGQDGSYLAEFLLKKDYEVHGLIRRSSSFNTGRIDHLISKKQYEGKFFFHHGDVTDAGSLIKLLSIINPDEIYNLAAQSHVKVSFDIPYYTAQVDALGTLSILDTIKEKGIDSKFYQASTSELFGKVQAIPQNENTPFYPRSPYGVAKLYAYWAIVNYREAYNIFACNGILFNHESPRRGETFVTRKITIAVSKIKKGIQDILLLGNLDAKRDWGYAPEYVEGMWLMLQQSKPDDYILSSGKSHTIREFVDLAFSEVGIEIEWSGNGLDEKGFDKSTGNQLVGIDKRYFRPTEVDQLLGDPTKARKKLKWQAKTDLKKLVKLMIDSDLKSLD
tara:strand:+ start:1663 stop:2697 length:1035 start_codon:yes stop_codon:yes gene_type:complete